MTMAEITTARRIEMACELPGARLWRFELWDDNQYIPYFYSPALDAEARRLVFIGRRSGQEQVYLLALDSDEVTQLTRARGAGQNWSPYIRQDVAGVRPQFIAWSQSDWEHVVYWENNTLCRVDTRTGESERLFDLPDAVVPSVPHCSAGGWVSWGTIPRQLQERLQQGASVPDLDSELRSGCGFHVYDLVENRPIMRIETPFWPNHVSVSPDHRWVLCCHEGAWTEQRMYVYDIEARTLEPLRPQEDGARIGHEFWIGANIVGYHGSRGGKGFFGTIDVMTGARTERPSRAVGAQHYGHYHVSPDGRFVVTDGEVSRDGISIACLDSEQLDFRTVCRHHWSRERDQRFHPHPHWHQSGRYITFTGCVPTAGGDVQSRVCLLELPSADDYRP
jgi:hypothetical protein